MFLLVIKIQMLLTAPPGGHHASPTTPTNLLCRKLQLGKQLFKDFFPQDLLSDLPPSCFGFFFFHLSGSGVGGQVWQHACVVGQHACGVSQTPRLMCEEITQAGWEQLLTCQHLLGLKTPPFLRVLRERFPSKCSNNL